MTKPTKWMCAQRRLNSIWASAQFDQSLRYPQEETLGPYLPTERTAKTLIRLGVCPGWSESSLGAHSLCWFCHVTAQLLMSQSTTKPTKSQDSNQHGHLPSQIIVFAGLKLCTHQCFPLRKGDGGIHWGLDNQISPCSKELDRWLAYGRDLRSQLNNLE